MIAIGLFMITTEDAPLRIVQSGDSLLDGLCKLSDRSRRLGGAQQWVFSRQVHAKWSPCVSKMLVLFGLWSGGWTAFSKNFRHWIWDGLSAHPNRVLWLRLSFWWTVS